MSCILQFDHLDRPRSRSILLVTDNQSGNTSVSLAQAAKLAADKGIRVYGFDSTRSPISGLPASDDQQAFIDATRSTGGDHFYLDDLSSVPSVLQRIFLQEKSALTPPARQERIDQPSWFASGALVLLVLAFIPLLGVRE